MNGVNTGESTNFTFTGQPAGGKYNTTVVLAGYYSEFEIITPARDETKVAVFNLTRSTGTLQINSTPDGARIYLNEVATGKSTNFTFTNKPVGEYNVTVVKDGYDTKTETVTLTNATTELVDFILVQQVGTLQINSTPSNASIYLNEVATGKSTNFTFTNKPVGEYNVTVVKDGYDTKTETVTLTNATTELVDFTLVQQVGTLQINSTPSNASIYLNEVATGKSTNFTFTNKPVGEYNVTVVKDGYDTKTETVTLTNATTERVDFTLVQQVGTLQVNSTPSNASIYLNEVSTGKSTNFTFANKPVDEYNVTVVKDGYDTKTEMVNLTNASTKLVDFTLVQQVGTLQVNSTPPSNASICLNEVATGKSTNFTFEGKPVGEYNVTVVKLGYDTKTETVTLTNASTERVDFTLVQQVGTLQVNSTPSNANIYLNEVATGESTNFTFTNKPVGEYNVTVQKSGYDSASRIVTLTKDETKDVSFTLSGQVGTLQINSTPSGASVYLNGTATGDLTNATLSDRLVGTYNVTVTKDGYDSASEIVTLTKDETKDVSFTLVRHLGDICVRSSPAAATIWLDGEDTGEFTNTTLTNITTGMHTITVEKPGYLRPANRSVMVASDEVTDVFFSLSQESGAIHVASTPDKAWIWLDGCNTTVLTNTTLPPDIPVGTHDIRLVKPLYYNTTPESVQVQANQTADVFFTLTPAGSKPTASFTATPPVSGGDSPLPVTFTDTSTGGSRTLELVVWRWKCLCRTEPGAHLHQRRCI
ncbi:PEGA domain-containing protein [Methanogenium cariaci]|uniref:PEGA domain-containing protein n=1 Tax=Methanogenium cariaci TaxID=2197 RepID=UPI0007811E3A|nr:PEGA domain-containing protein [Methanogenium cariaci]